MSRRLLLVLSTWAALLVLVACSAPETPATETVAPTGVAPTSLLQPTVYANVSVVPARSTELSFRFGGLVDEVMVTPGDVVTAGQVLARQDTTYLELSVQREEAGVAAAQAWLDLLQSSLNPQEIAIAQSNLTAAEAALSRAIAQRAEVYADAAASQNDRDAAEASVRQAVAGRDAAQASLELLQAGSTDEQLASARITVTQAQLALEQAQQQLADAELRAPFAGTIVSVAVQPGENATSAEVAVVLADLNRFTLETTDIGPAGVAQLRVGQPARVWLDAFPDTALTARVQQIALSGTVLSSGQVVFLVQLELDSTDLSLRWGMTGLAEIDTTGSP